MKIQKLKLKDFMLFQELELDWSKNINVICGSNSTGKTALLKVMYSLLTSYCQTDNSADKKDKIEARFVDKITHVFRPEDMSVGRLARRVRGSSRCEGSLQFANNDTIKFAFGNRASTRMDLNLPIRTQKPSKENTTVYFPPKEIISSTENFRTLYEDMHIAFEETYYDLARLLGRPLKKGKNSEEQNLVLAELGEIINGTITQRENKFYLNVAGQGEFEMGLVSEGYRKLATIIYLILNGSLNANSVLFWDEPEANMNPAMIYPLVRTVMLLARFGVQVFITTHDYFLLQYFNMYMNYPELNEDKIDVQFVSLSRNGESGHISAEAASKVEELRYNSIMEEFDAIYKREQEIIYGDTRK